MNDIFELLAKSLRLPPPSGRVVFTAVLRPTLLLAIVLVAGSDLFAVAELTTLLDILGATLFLVAYGAGLRSLTRPAFDWLKALFVPTEYRMLLMMRGRPIAIGFGLVFVVGHALYLATLGWLSCVGISILVHSVS